MGKKLRGEEGKDGLLLAGRQGKEKGKEKKWKWKVKRKAGKFWL